MEIALMIEGQNGLNWERWQRIVRAAEDLGFVGLYRSDHFTNPQPPDLDALELWVSLTWLASNTKRIEFGPLVSPVSFRHPVLTAKMAAAIDDLSGGRLQLGLGAGWQEREHAHYGFDLLNVPQRKARFQEALDVVTRLLQSDEPVTFDGTYYHLQEATLLPRPHRIGGPPIVIGGGKSILPFAARYASEWNVAFLPAGKFATLNTRLDELLEKEGRRPDAVRRSLMTRIIFGRNDHEVQQKLQSGEQTIETLHSKGILVGTRPEIKEQLEHLSSVGVQRVMLQWLDLDNLTELEAMAQSVLPGV
jgi:F420-dependent oxidoreductase-like protein